MSEWDAFIAELPHGLVYFWCVPCQHHIFEMALEARCDKCGREAEFMGQARAYAKAAVAMADE